EDVPLEVGLTVPRFQERQVAVRRWLGAHGSCRRLARMITSTAVTRSASAAIAISADAVPSGATRVGTPLPVKPPTGVIIGSPFTAQDRDRVGPLTIGPQRHFLRSGRPGTSGGRRVVPTGYWSGDARRSTLAREPSVSRETTKVLLVDDHPVFREGLRQCLEARKDFRVLAAVGSGEEMWKAIRAHGRPQIVLMDVEMPGEGGSERTNR